jgi:hypothetical protein
VGFVEREKNYLPTTAPESKSKPTYWSSPTQGHPATISYWKKNRYKAHTQELLAGPQHKQQAKGLTYFMSSILRLPFFSKSIQIHPDSMKWTCMEYHPQTVNRWQWLTLHSQFSQGTKFCGWMKNQSIMQKRESRYVSRFQEK